MIRKLALLLTALAFSGAVRAQTIVPAGGSGGSSTPGGSTAQIQYNNAGAFAGISGATSDGTVLTLVAPVLGAATATTINGVTIPSATDTVALLGATQTLTGVNTFAPTAAASPAAVSTQFAASVATGTTNAAGVTTTFKGSQGTGTGAGGSIIFQTAPAGSTGSAQNALVTALTIDSTGKATFAGNIAVAVLTSGGITDNGTISTTGYVRAGAAQSIFWNNRSSMQSGSDGNINLTNFAGTDFSKLQFGGTTSSFPALKRSTTTLQVRLADDSADAAIKASTYIAGGSPPTLTGTCTTGTQVGGNTAGSFAATCTAQTVIITFATTAPNGWVCNAQDETMSADLMTQTAHSTTSCTLSGTTGTGNVIVFNAVAF